MRTIEILVSTAAIMFAVIRVVMMLVKLMGAVGTVDALATTLGYGDVVEPYEQWFDAWFVHPLLSMVEEASTPTSSK